MPKDNSDLRPSVRHLQRMDEDPGICPKCEHENLDFEPTCPGYQQDGQWMVCSFGCSNAWEISCDACGWMGITLNLGIL